MWRCKGWVCVVRVNQEAIRWEHSWLSLTPYCSWLKCQEQPGKQSAVTARGKKRYFVLLQRAGIVLDVLCLTAGWEADLSNFGNFFSLVKCANSPTDWTAAQLSCCERGGILIVHIGPSIVLLQFYLLQMQGAQSMLKLKIFYYLTVW